MTNEPGRYPPPPKETLGAEIEALRGVYNALRDLTPEKRARVLRAVAFLIDLGGVR